MRQKREHLRVKLRNYFRQRENIMLADDMKLIHHRLAHSGVLDQLLREHDSMYFHIIRCGQQLDESLGRNDYQFIYSNPIFGMINDCFQRTFAAKGKKPPSVL